MTFFSSQIRITSFVVQAIVSNDFYSLLKAHSKFKKPHFLPFFYTKKKKTPLN